MITVSIALDGLSELKLHHATVLLLLVFGLASLVGYWLRATQQTHPLFSPACFDSDVQHRSAGQSVRPAGKWQHALSDPAVPAGGARL